MAHDGGLGCFLEGWMKIHMAAAALAVGGGLNAGLALAGPGVLLWGYGRQMNCTGSPLAVQGRVYWNGVMGSMGCFAGVTALSEAGEFLWATPPGIGDNGSMSVGADGAVYVNS